MGNIEDPHTTPEQRAWINDIVAAEVHGERISIEIGPFAAYTLIGMIQVASRHPGMTPRLEKVARGIVEELRRPFAGTPGHDLVDRGWDPTQDVPR